MIIRRWEEDGMHSFRIATAAQHEQIEGERREKARCDSTASQWLARI